MKPWVPIVITSSAALLIAAHRRENAIAQAADGDMGAFDFAGLLQDVKDLINRTTASNTVMPATVATQNAYAFLAMIRASEGTANEPDPYRTCYGYKHIIQDLSDHPAVTGEWTGERLSDGMCAGAGYGPGCRSTAAGAYQVIRGTWLDIKDHLGLRDFSQMSQDQMALGLIERKGALGDVQDGRITQAIAKVSSLWASLPGSKAGQGKRTIEWLQLAFESAGGNLA